MKKFLCIFLGCALLCAGGLGVYAAGSQSAHYRISMDAVASGGGASGSAHYINADSSIGQDSPAGVSSSATKIDNAGVVQTWPIFKNSVVNWTCYD